MPTAIDSGTQSATISTEHTLTTQTGGGTFVLVVDMNALVGGDTVELRIYTKCLSGGTERLAYYRLFANVQATPMKFSVPVPANISFKATLKQTAGTGRSFPWSVLTL